MSDLGYDKAATGRFSGTDAAMTGFRLVGRSPVTMLIWGGAIAVLTMIATVLTISAAGPQLTALQNVTQSAGGRPDPSAMVGLLARLAPFYFVALMATPLIYGVFYAAVNRAVLRPGEGAPAYLRLGADELRQAAVIVLSGLVFIAAYIAGAILLVVLVGVGSAVWRPAGLIFGIVAVPAYLFGLVWLGVRLSLASPLSFDTRRVRVFGSFALTRGRFWSLFGAYLLTAVLIMAGYVAFFTVMAALAAVMGGGVGGVGALLTADMSSLAGYFAPIRIVYLVLSGFFTALVAAVFVGAPVGAYAQLRPQRAVEVF